MYITKSICPRTEPCGILGVTSFTSEFFPLTHVLRSIR